MNKVILYIAASLDLFIADKQGGVDWLPQPDGTEDTEDLFGFKGLMQRIELIAMGSRSYQQILGFGVWAWPDKQTYVFTSQNLSTELPCVTFIDDEPKAFMEKIKLTQPNKNIWLLGGAKLAHSFARAGLIDEVILTLIPVNLGDGIKLELDWNDFILDSEKPCRDGMVQKIYKPKNDVNEVLHALKEGAIRILGKNLVGFYLTGSLSYGDFNPKSSDIDLLTVLNKPASQEALQALKQLHLQVEENHKKWAKRIECSYIPLDMLHSVQTPETARPYIGEGIFYAEAPYGNEWIINQYLLYKHGIPLIGPDFKTLVKPIDILDVREACIRDLFEEWQPKMNDPTFLNNSHYQSYIVLNLCRILYTVICHSTASKKACAAWVKSEFGPDWDNLIQTAENWHYGIEMNLQKETIEFIKFVVNQVTLAQNNDVGAV